MGSKNDSWTIIAVGACISRVGMRREYDDKVNDTIDWLASAISVIRNSATHKFNDSLNVWKGIITQAVV